MTIEPEVAFDKIRHMTSSEIAEFFKAEGIQGYVGKPSNCPIANYLTRETDQYFIVCVGSIHSCAGGIESEFHVKMNPPGVMDFVMNFDRGDYPELRKDVFPRVRNNYGS